MQEPLLELAAKTRQEEGDEMTSTRIRKWKLRMVSNVGTCDDLVRAVSHRSVTTSSAVLVVNGANRTVVGQASSPGPEKCHRRRRGGASIPRM
jgi:hypothetical protein